MQKVITIHVLGDTIQNSFKEYKFPELEKILEEGYSIMAVHQMSSKNEGGEAKLSISGVYLTFILSK
jgi:hypothetical protein